MPFSLTPSCNQLLIFRLCPNVTSSVKPCPPPSRSAPPASGLLCCLNTHLSPGGLQPPCWDPASSSPIRRSLLSGSWLNVHTALGYIHLLLGRWVSSFPFHWLENQAQRSEAPPPGSGNTWARSLAPLCSKSPPSHASSGAASLPFLPGTGLSAPGSGIWWLVSVAFKLCPMVRDTFYLCVLSNEDMKLECTHKTERRFPRARLHPAICNAFSHSLLVFPFCFILLYPFRFHFLSYCCNAGLIH